MTSIALSGQNGPATASHPVIGTPDTPATCTDASDASLYRACAATLRLMLPALSDAITAGGTRRLIVEALETAAGDLEALADAGREAAYSDLAEDVARHAATLDAARIAAEQRAEHLAERIIEVGLQAATNAIGRIERIDGPDPNGYVRFTTRDYARAALTAALDAVGYQTGDLDAAAQDHDARGGEA